MRDGGVLPLLKESQLEHVLCVIHLDLAVLAVTVEGMEDLSCHPCDVNWDLESADDATVTIGEAVLDLRLTLGPKRGSGSEGEGRGQKEMNDRTAAAATAHIEENYSHGLGWCRRGHQSRPMQRS